MSKTKNKKQKNKSTNLIKGVKVSSKYMTMYKPEFMVVVLASIFIGVIGAILPYLSGKIVDAVLSKDTVGIFSSEYSLYMVVLFIYGLLLLIEVFSNYFKNLWSALLRNKIYVDYKKRSFNKMMALPFSFHKSKKFGAWSSNFDRASGSLAYLIGVKTATILPEIFVLIFSVLISFSINIVLGSILLFGVILYTMVVFSVAPQIEKLSKKENKQFKKMQGLFFESFSNIFEVKKNSTEKKELSRFNSTAAIFKRGMDKVTRKWRSVELQRSIVSSMTRLIILILAVHWAVTGVVSVGEILILNSYAFRVFRPITMISDFWIYITESFIKIVDAEETMETIPESYDPEELVSLPKNFKGEIEFDNVEFAYGEKEKNVLKKVNLNIEQGQKVAFVGESGVGKSTAIDLIGGFYFPQKGSVKIDGIDSKKLGLEDLRSKIAFVSQDISLFNDTVENNIKYGSKRTNSKKVIEASKKAFADDFIKEFPKKYKQKVGNRGIKLSGGQKQRISIARAILRDPKILILDEPTSSLDIKSEKYITESLDDLMKGRTTIIIAHRLSTVRNVDKIFVFKNGKVVEEGSHKELLELGGEYKNMHDMHIGLN